MINLNIRIEEKFLESSIKAVEGMEIRVGILDKNKRAKVANRKREPKKKVGDTGMNGSYVKKNADITLGELAIYLDAQYSVFSDAVTRGDNHQLNIVTQELIKAFSGDQINKRRIENAAIRFIKNPIQRKEFGRNDSSTSKAKGFDWPMVDTGTFFSSIEAEIVNV